MPLPVHDAVTAARLPLGHFVPDQAHLQRYGAVRRSVGAIHGPGKRLLLQLDEVLAQAVLGALYIEIDLHPATSASHRPNIRYSSFKVPSQTASSALHVKADLHPF
jgi:hypothetical protein